MPAIVFAVSIFFGLATMTLDKALNIAFICFGVMVAAYGELRFDLTGFMLQVWVSLCVCLCVCVIEMPCDLTGFLLQVRGIGNCALAEVDITCGLCFTRGLPLTVCLVSPLSLPIYAHITPAPSSPPARLVFPGGPPPGPHSNPPAEEGPQDEPHYHAVLHRPRLLPMPPRPLPHL